MTVNINNRNCLIIGATGGIGNEIAQIFAKNSCNLFLVGRNKKKLEKMKKDLVEKFGVKIFFMNTDLSNNQNIRNLISQVRKQLGKIDVLINSAGVFVEKSIMKTSLEEFEQCHTLNVKVPFILCKEFTKDMDKNGWGRIVNIGSSSAYQGFANGSAYCSSKHGLLGLSRALFNELKKKNIRVFCISPGSTKTRMGKKCKNQNYETFINPKEIAEYVFNIISFDKEMVIEESRLNRIKME